MSKYLCVTCGNFHETLQGMKNCSHEGKPVVAKKPKKGNMAKKETIVETKEKISQEEANKLFKNLSSLKDDKIEELAHYLDIPFTTKTKTVNAIKAKVGN